MQHATNRITISFVLIYPALFRLIPWFPTFCVLRGRQHVEQTKQYAKKFVRYKEGAEKYSLGLTKFQELAKEAKAVYKIDGIALVNCEIFEKFLESFREF